MQTRKACDLDEIAAEIRARGDRTGRRILVGVDGPGASGKSTLAALLAERLPGAAIVHVDDFYRPSGDERPDGFGADFDLERLERQVLRPAFADGTVRYQRYDWDSDRLAEWHDVPAHIPLVIEGVYSTRAGVRDLYTYRIYCHTPANCGSAAVSSATAPKPRASGSTGGCPRRTATRTQNALTTTQIWSWTARAPRAPTARSSTGRRCHDEPAAPPAPAPVTERAAPLCSRPWPRPHGSAPRRGDAPSDRALTDCAHGHRTC